MPTANGTATIHRLTAVEDPVIEPVGDIVLVQRENYAQSDVIWTPESSKEESPYCVILAMSESPATPDYPRPWKKGDRVVVGGRGILINQDKQISLVNQANILAIVR